ncbi:MAG: hypothetical protein NUV47_01130 [Patescibacteria group bacterium]|nr:hypothetical protein [Patescibacteria group bacterium]
MKIRIKIIIEYEVDAKFYPENATPEEILDMDTKHIKYDTQSSKDKQSFFNVYPCQITSEIIQ